MKATQQFICDIADKISMPDIYQQIRQLMADPETKIEAYAQVIQADPMLAIRIIRIANSQFFGFHRQANDLYEAISLIGIVQLHDLLLSSLCMRTFANIPGQILNTDDFWRHGVKCGIAAHSIAKMRGMPAANRFFTLGLLLEIGHALMFIKSPELALTAFLESQQQHKAITDIEQEYFGFDYAQLGAALLQHWHLPAVYPQTVAYHLSPEHSHTDFRIAAEIANLAHQFCENNHNNQIGTDKKLTGEQVAAAIQDDIAERINKVIQTHIEEVFNLLSPPHFQHLAMSDTEM